MGAMSSPLPPAEAATVVRVDARQCEVMGPGEAEVRLPHPAALEAAVSHHFRDGLDQSGWQDLLEGGAWRPVDTLAPYRSLWLGRTDR